MQWLWVGALRPACLAVHCCCLTLERRLDFPDPASCKMRELHLKSHLENLMMTTKMTIITP